MTISSSTITKSSIAIIAALTTIAAAPTIIAAAPVIAAAVSSITLAHVAGVAAGVLTIIAGTALGCVKSCEMIDNASKNNGFSGLMLPFFAAPAVLSFILSSAIAAPIGQGVYTAAKCLL